MRSPRRQNVLAMTLVLVIARSASDEAIPHNIMKTPRYYAVYIMTNTYGTVLYTGVTNNLAMRVGQHKLKEKGFTAKYNITKLVYYEVFQDIIEAIKREKKIKGGSRNDKVRLIVKKNPLFRDLYEKIL